MTSTTNGRIGVGFPRLALWTKLKGFEPPSLSCVHNNGLTQEKGATLSLICIETTILHLANTYLPFVSIETSFPPILNYVKPP